MPETPSPSPTTNGTQATATDSTPDRTTTDIARVSTFSSLWKLSNESLGLLTTLGLITALLYMFGRTYASALLTSLKLPEILVPPTLTQYYEWGAVPLFFFAVFLATAVAYGLGIRFFWSNACFFVLVLAIDGLLTLLTWPLRAFWRWLPKRPQLSWLRLPSFQMPESLKAWLRSRLPRYQSWFPVTDAESRRLQQLSQYFTTVVGVIVGLVVLGSAFVWVLNQSVLLGRASTTQVLVHPARLFLTKPLSARPMPTTTLSDGAHGYVYDDLFLIARGEERYFVFDAIDPATCTPREILQVPANSVVDAVYGAPTRLRDLCQALAPAPSPAPALTQSPAPAPTP